MVIIRGPFLGKTNHRSGKDDADEEAHDVAEEGYEEASPLWMISYNIYDVFTHLYTTPSPNCGKEYPRPQQHGKDANQQANVIGSGTINGYGYCFRIGN